MIYNKEKRHQQYLKRKEQHSEWHKRYYQEHKEELLEDSRQWYQENKNGRSEYVREHRRKRKLEALIHYGDGKLACTRCGFDDERALSIDHTTNNGAEHRRRMSGRKSPDGRIGMWLKARGYPEGYQTLCMNCQFIKEVERREGVLTK